ncbi:MAG: DNA mismatch repair protein MutS, partial [Candidatus Omnitrophica bacterium]|nr:DNA mismatch repair protein MutS [Candidatus Omnitrophota bacterium]
QSQEIKRSGISSLKIGFNKVFGYYIEITKANLNSVPDNYIRKQTLVNAERFITPELKDFEESILTSEEKILKIESEIVARLQQKILDSSLNLHRICQQLATIDTLSALSLLASNPSYCQPEITEASTLKIYSGRHPVVETHLSDTFVANDTTLDCQNNHLLIITGPNMAGKSTYIRQVALLVILAQIGSFIPAEKATIGIVDKIFTRIGASDDISKGQSTFMVEMSETAEIINNATKDSLLILDEIGRGTSTFDGLSLAWAIAEDLAEKKVRSLFATHFHELTALADAYSGVKNYNVSVKEWRDEIIFLHKIIPGGSDDSYGIYVAKLAGIPQSVLHRSKEILTELEINGNLKEKIKKTNKNEKQLSLFTANDSRLYEEFKKDLDAIDINALTPLEALNVLSQFKAKRDK